MTGVLTRYPAIWLLLAVGSAAFIPSRTYWEWSVVKPWVLLLVGLVAIIGVEIGKRIHWSVVPAFIWTVSSGILQVGLRPYEVQTGYPVQNTDLLGRLAGYSLVAFLILTGFLLLMDARQRFRIQQGFAWICILGSLAVIFRLGNFCGNPSMTGCLIAICYPFLLTRTTLEPGWKPWALTWELICWVAPVAAVFQIGETMPVLTLAAVILALPVVRASKALMAGSAALLVLSYAFQGERFLSSSGRLEVWLGVLEYWWAVGNPWSGFGLGSAHALIPMIQEQLGIAPGLAFTFAHSEGVRLLFELGILGLLTYALAIGCALFSVRRYRAEFAALVGFLVCSLANYPSSLPLHAFVGMALVAMAFQRKGVLMHP